MIKNMTPEKLKEIENDYNKAMDIRDDRKHLPDAEFFTKYGYCKHEVAPGINLWHGLGREGT